MFFTIPYRNIVVEQTLFFSVAKIRTTDIICNTYLWVIPSLLLGIYYTVLYQKMNKNVQKPN